MNKLVAKLYLSLLLLLLLFSAEKSFAVDLFEWLQPPQFPMVLKKPDWLETGSKISFKYSSSEYYKRWRESRLINDFSGSSSGLDLSLQLLPRLAFGFRKTFMEPQIWKNSLEGKAARFDFKSDSGSDEVFVRFNTHNITLEAGSGNSRSGFEGSYELHRDIVNALGKNPPVYLNNSGTHHYVKLYVERGRTRFFWYKNRIDYDHQLRASTPAMALELNLHRQYDSDAFELAWLHDWRVKPFLRYETIKDKGAGDNFRDGDYRFGSNSSDFSVNLLSLGTRFDWRKNQFFVEFSKYSFKSSLSTHVNLITLNPLFLFGTNRVEYLQTFEPDKPWGIRIGFLRSYRGVEYAGQYSMLAMEGNTLLASQKAYNMFASTDYDTDRQRLQIDLHRASFCAKRPDKHGNWQATLNLMAPVADIKEIGETAVASPAPPGPAAAKAPKPAESIRGGWQISLIREFRL